MSQSTRIRKNVLTLGSPGDDLDWYGRAVAAMQALPITDPTGWRYQSAVHGYPGHAQDPFATQGEALPSRADQKRFWDQCQHQTWFFLPWHRGYLACFEEIVAATVVRLGGPVGWALPYWNYSEAGQPAALSLPAAFLPPTQVDGSPNPLWLAGRSMASSADQIPVSDVDLGCLTHPHFAGSAAGGLAGFGGPRTGFTHFGGTNGDLESAPHNLIHGDVGGLMNDPNTAALDPIFWLHHANIDRLWEVWRQRDPHFINPADAAWLTGTNFELHDSAGALVRYTASQMLDTRTVRHGYTYDDTSDPIAPSAAAVFAMSVPAGPAPDVRLVGASEPSIALAGASTTARVAIDQPARNSILQTLAVTRPPRVFLNLEQVTGTTMQGVYDVYVGVPGSAAGASLLAGHLSTFGVRKASRPDNPHGGNGITTVFEITRLVERLHKEGWDGQHLDVTFAARDKAPAAMDLTVGRIGVYYG